jgi:hypothetical protein
VAQDRSLPAHRGNQRQDQGHNRVIKQIKQVADAFRHQANYERPIMMHNATRQAASTTSVRGQTRSSAMSPFAWTAPPAGISPKNGWMLRREAAGHHRDAHRLGQAISFVQRRTGILSGDLGRSPVSLPEDSGLCPLRRYSHRLGFPS